jgi:hypothetical protein
MEPDEPDVITTDGIVDTNEFAEDTPYKYSISSYGADFDASGLVRRLDQGSIIIPSFDPGFESATGVVGFQRQFVWTKVQADRFIESLLLGLPVPGIFLVREEGTNLLLVLDGQQRLRTLQRYYAGVFGRREFRLQHVVDQFKGRAYKDLDDQDRRALDDYVIHTTVIRQEEPKADYTSIYLIFERLNTGGTALQPQEIRVALFRGPFVELLRELNSSATWRNLVGPPSPRLKDQELILRFFAMLEAGKDYKRPLKGFLNQFMASKRSLDAENAKSYREIFNSTTDTLFNSVGPQVFRPTRPVNAAVVDSVMTAVARRLKAGPIVDSEGLAQAYSDLITDSRYLQAVETSTAAEESVATRLQLATDAFASVS